MKNIPGRSAKQTIINIQSVYERAYEYVLKGDYTRASNLYDKVLYKDFRDEDDRLLDLICALKEIKRNVKDEQAAKDIMYEEAAERGFLEVAATFAR